MDQQLTCPQYIEYLRYVFAAYTLVWIGLFLYLTSLTRRRRALERELGELQALMEREKD
jgi:CcmD family protein